MPVRAADGRMALRSRAADQCVRPASGFPFRWARPVYRGAGWVRVPSRKVSTIASANAADSTGR